MKSKLFLSILMLGVASALKAVDVAAIVWPAYQPEPRWKELGIFEHGNGEWQNVYEATTKFKGHHEPRVPYWGYENEADPKVVARKIDAALAAGINVFIYDWYWYAGRPFLENALNEGFLKAPNNERMKFYVMYANHDVDNTWDNSIEKKYMKKPHWSADITFEEFKEKLVPRWIEYFKKPNYYKIAGRPVFWLYHPETFIRSLGAEKAKEALQYLDKAARDAGFEKGIHLQFSGGYARPALRISKDKKVSPAEAFRYFNVDSYTAYNWRGLVPMKGKFPYENVDYETWGEECMKRIDAMPARYETSYCPQVTIGWDNNARFPKTITTGVTTNANPKAFEKFLKQTVEWVEKNPTKDGAKLIIINSWNEWTEGNFFEPDEIYGFGYLEAFKKVFEK